MENAFAKSIRLANDKSDYDAACKRLLSEKHILAWIMKECVQEYAGLDVEEIIHYIEGSPQTGEVPVAPDETVAPFIVGSTTEDKSLHEGTVTFDIRFFARTPGTGEALRLILNIEAQSNFYPGYPLIKRGIYYCSRMISSQYGTEFTGSHYEKIKKVYSIWICTNPPRHRENTITRYSLHETNIIGNVHEKPGNYDLLSAILICLGEAPSEESPDVLHLLQTLLLARKDTEEKKNILRTVFRIPMTETLESEVDLMCNLSQGLEERGRQRGREEGMEKALLESIQNLMETLKLTAEQAMNALRIPEKDRNNYMAMLK